jgi:adenosylhomocysteine nucleosidase
MSLPTLRRVVLLGAMEQEVAAFAQRLADGCWRGVEIHLATTGLGKSAAAATAQRLIDRHQPEAVIFTGVAGALDPQRRIGEVGIGVAAIDAELDLRSLLPETLLGQDPFTGVRLHRSHPSLVTTALQSGVAGCFPAYIATGSAFLDTAGKARFRTETLPHLEAELDGVRRLPDLIEMEGSAVLQTAASNGVAALAIRAVSDAVVGDAVADFHGFLAQAIGRYALIVDAVLRRHGPQGV